MLSRAQQKLLRKLSSKKYRQQFKMFIAEGRKVVAELLQEGLIPEFLIALPQSEFVERAIQITEEELKHWSSFETPDEVIGVFHFPELPKASEEVVLVLDEIKDPGNLGTIIRTCDWFGVNTIYCTTGTTDVFNPKTVQSTMGSIGRVGVSYYSREEIFEKLNAEGYSLLCADMEGETIGQIILSEKTALIMGSESHGPSAFWKEKAICITIPRKENSKVESLNVAVATAILLSGLSR